MAIPTKDKFRSLMREPLLEKLELELDKPNFFRIVRMENVEIRHSNFLAWLLSPQENHGLGNLFLKKFLKDIFALKSDQGFDEFSIDLLDLFNIEVRREWNNIDLLIIAEKFDVCIENKVWTSEHSNQLTKYRNIVKKTFPEHQRFFVYLTPFGTSPEKQDDQEFYVPYSYSAISEQIRLILELHSQSLSPKILNYIEDYVMIVEQEILKEAGANEIARKIYSAHREALDFIFENKPDSMSQFATILEVKIKEIGWIKCHCHKGYFNFLTEKLKAFIPISNDPRHTRETFLFQIDYWPKNITLKALICPGSEEHRKILYNSLMKVEGAKGSKANFWTSPIKKSWLFDVNNQKLTDEGFEKKIEEILPKIEQFVNQVEEQLLKIQNQFK
ncbi:PD-(D/E)XK nuclease family protein [Candidatus Riflebacteria bacterium]